LARCRQLAAQAASDIAPLIYQTCAVQAQSATTATGQTPIGPAIGGATTYINPPVRNLGGNFSFGLTDNWSVSWNTSFDFVKHEFAQHMVTLQRDLHDWRAVFAFTQSPNGNFAFNFFIALKAEPDLKFNYDKATVRSGSF
jgi:hypothetical protein